MRIVELDPHERVYVVEDLIRAGRRLTVHAERLRKYADAGLKVTEDLKAIIDRHGNEYEVSQIVKHRRRDGAFQLYTTWCGYEDVDAERTWEPLDAMYADVPKLVKEYVDSLPPSRDRTAMLATLALRE